MKMALSVPAVAPRVPAYGGQVPVAVPPVPTVPAVPTVPPVVAVVPLVPVPAVPVPVPPMGNAVVPAVGSALVPAAATWPPVLPPAPTWPPVGVFGIFSGGSADAQAMRTIAPRPNPTLPSLPTVLTMGRIVAAV